MALSLRTLMEDALEISRKSVAATKDMMMPMWTLLHENGEISMVATPFTDDGPSKDMAVAWVQNYIREKNVISYVFANEAWSVSRKSEKAIRESLPPSECADRQEIIMLFGASRTEGQLHCMCPILPGRQTGEAKWMDGAQMQGRFVLDLGQPNEVVGHA